MGGGERVVDVDNREGGEGAGELGIVGFFFRVKAEVLEEHDVPGLEGGHGRGDLRTDAVRQEGHGTPQQLLEASCHRLEGESRVGLALGSPEVGGKDDARSSLQAALHGGEGSTDARVLPDSSVFEGDVEIHAKEDTLPPEVQVIDAQRGQRYKLLAMYLIRSFTRFE